MLITNHTRQIFIPSETMVGITLSYMADDFNKFFTQGSDAPGDERPRVVEVTVVGQSGILKFTEHYIDMDKAKKATGDFLLACASGQAVFTFPLDEDYVAFMEAERARKRKQAEQQRPAYQQEEPTDGKKQQ